MKEEINNKEFRLKNATLKVNEIIVNKLLKLPYFNNSNFNKNISTLKRILITDGPLLEEGQLAAYSSKTNSLYVDYCNICESISDEQLEILILHEYIHMASTDLKKQIIGFESEIIPITYNEAITQWLTLKLYYGDENLNKAIEKNIIYPESVKLIDSFIKDVNEENVLNGFFEANIKKNTTQFPKENKNKLFDIIIRLGNSQEEQISQKRLDNLNKKLYSKEYNDDFDR